MPLQTEVRMLTYMNDFLSRYPYPAEAKDAYLTALNTCLESSRACAMFEALLKRYEDDMLTSYKALLEDMKTISEMIDIPEPVGNAILIISLTKQLKVYYAQKGFSEELFYRTMHDILYKTLECKDVRGLYGIFVPDWYMFFFHLRTFSMQRLQFQITNFGKEYTDGDVTLKPDSTIIAVHIPRTGTPMDHDLVLQDYAEAAKFFVENGYVERPVFTCSSWLLFSRHREMLSEKSNIIQFMNDFTILDERLYDDYAQVWRLFDMEYTGDVDALPADSSLRRGYIDLIRKGEKTGTAVGIFIGE